MIWSGIGMNYGHVSTYDTTQVEDDFNFFGENGITRLRIAMPPYNSSVNIPHGKDMVQRALTHGFYAVWGVTTSGVVDATAWSAWKSYVLNTLVPWAQSNRLSELCLGNEFELHADGTTLTSATVRSDLRTMATSIKAGGFTGKISYSTSILQTYRTPWINEGIGDLDLIGWNSYDVLSNFNTRNGVVQSSLGSKTYLSEFGCISNGYGDYNDETLWYNDVVARISSMQNAGIQSGYFFCYRDGGYGLTPNTFALVETNGAIRLARQAVTGQ